MAVAAMTNHAIRPLSEADVERLTAIDREHTGETRRAFFRKRLTAAQKHPDDFVHVGIIRGGALRGFAIARILRGEFGRRDAIAVLDAIGVEIESQERGVGQNLVEALTTAMRARNVNALHSQVAWTSHDLLRFFDACGFALSGRMVLERSANTPLLETADEP